MNKTTTATFKAQLVVALRKETKTLNQLAAEHRVPPNVLRAWRDQALKALPAAFDTHDSCELRVA